MKSRDKRSQVGAGHAVQEQLLPTASENGPETVQKAWPEGSEWRKWDLHVHSPASENFTGDFNQLIIQLGNADCAVIGINDYFSVAGYGEVRKRLSDPGEKARGNQAYREALVKLRDKTLLPVVECRMQNVVLDRTKKSGPRINFHIIFSPDVPVDDIETFIKGLMVKGAQIGTHYNDKAFLLNDASVDFFETLKKLRSDSTFANRVLLWIPYDEYGGIDKINPATDPLFKQGLVFEADILGSSNKRQSEFFLWRDNKVTEEQFRAWFGRRKPCIKGSDSHNVNDEIGNLKDEKSKPTDKHCWIKADPTFDGLRQIVNEPADRVYIGKKPPKLEEVAQNPTRYLERVRIVRAQDAVTDDAWFNCDVPLNADMVAIIGNKGSGKSALTDILALVGNTHCDPSYFSFLHKDRFCERNGRIAKQFEVSATWRDGSTSVHRLNDKPNVNSVELVRYIPQSYLEKVCTETEPGERSEFQQELRKVIFSHISDADRLGKSTLDELIEYRTEELKAELGASRGEMAKLNSELVRLEAKKKSEHRAKLESQIALRQKQLDAHEAIKPTPIEKPSNTGPEEMKVLTKISTDLEAVRKQLSAVEADIAGKRARQKVLAEEIAIAKKLEVKLDNFSSDFARLKQDCSSDLVRLGIALADILDLKLDKSKLVEKREGLLKEKDTIDATLSPTSGESLLLKIEGYKNEIKALQDKLDAPNRRYEEYQEAIKAWQEKTGAIEGSDAEPETLRYYKAQVAFIEQMLPKEMEALRARRVALARKIHANIANIRDIYRELFAPVQDLIQESVLIKEGFRLTFDGRIVDRTFQRDFFDKYVNQHVSGSFCSKEKGATMLETLRGDYDFNKADDAIAFAGELISYLEQDMRSEQRPSVEVQSQLRKYVETKDIYDYVWCLTYLEPEYSLKLDGKELGLLSPGERGTLLLIFYLLVDKTNSPVIVDQPEENLDNQTVYKLLIPVIKEVKKRRQIVMVTHSPNIAVVCDAEQVIRASIDRAAGSRVAYAMGSIESREMNRFLVDVLEGTRPAFENRESKYYPT